jgi:hypothetical protein
VNEVCLALRSIGRSLMSNSLKYFAIESGSSLIYSSIFLRFLTGKVKNEPPASFKV